MRSANDTLKYHGSGFLMRSCKSRIRHQSWLLNVFFLPHRQQLDLPHFSPCEDFDRLWINKSDVKFQVVNHWYLLKTGRWWRPVILTHNGPHSEIMWEYYTFPESLQSCEYFSFCYSCQWCSYMSQCDNDDHSLGEKFGEMIVEELISSVVFVDRKHKTGFGWKLGTCPLKTLPHMASLKTSKGRERRMCIVVSV